MKKEVIICQYEDQYWSDIRSIRDRVFIEEQAVAPEEEIDEFEISSRHFLALMEGVPAGTARWRQTENGIKLERFAVLMEMRKNGIGRLLVQHVLEDVFREISAPTMVYLHAQAHAITFYEACGFEAFGEEFSESDIHHRKMRYTQP